MPWGMRRSTRSLNLGHHTLRAVYVGSALDAGSNSAPFLQTVGKAHTTVTLASSASTGQVGKEVQIVASVTPPFAGSPIGSVTFKEGNTILGTALVNGGGAATLKLASLTKGRHSITAIYSGSSCFLGNTSTAFEIIVG